MNRFAVARQRIVQFCDPDIESRESEYPEDDEGGFVVGSAVW